MEDEPGLSMLSDRSQLGYRVKASAERIARRSLYADLSASDRDELVGVAIDKYYGAWGKLGQPDNVDAWLSVVMRNALMDLFRQRRRRVDHGADGDLNSFLDGILEPGPSLSRPVAAGMWREKFLEQLTTGDAELIVLRGDGYSSREIGEFLGINANAVDVRLHRLRARLKQLLAEEPS